MMRNRIYFVGTPRGIRLICSPRVFDIGEDIAGEPRRAPHDWLNAEGEDSIGFFTIL